MCWFWEADVVLWNQWLYTLGLIQWDFKKLTMEFIKQGKPVLLQGLRPSGLLFKMLMFSSSLPSRKAYCCRSSTANLLQNQFNNMLRLTTCCKNSTRSLLYRLIYHLIAAMNTRLCQRRALNPFVKGLTGIHFIKSLPETSCLVLLVALCLTSLELGGSHLVNLSPYS